MAIVDIHPPTLDSDATPPTKPSKYCSNCSYPLDGLDKWRCPECGRMFHPHKPQTFSRSPGKNPDKIAEHHYKHLAKTKIIALGGMIAMFAVEYFAVYSLSVVWLLFILFPIWKVCHIMLGFKVIESERFSGLLFWIVAGVVMGTVCCLLLGQLGLIVGPFIGAVAGALRAMKDYRSV